MAATPHYTPPDRSHSGSSKDDIENEPDWAKTHNHRIGFRDRNIDIQGTRILEKNGIRRRSGSS